MTNEEAINVLRNAAWLGTNEQREEVEQAVEVATEALQKQYSHDCISRQAAIDALSMMQGIIAEEGVRKGISMAWQQIKDLPSAQPKMKCIANVTMTDEQVKEAFEKAKCELLAAQPDHIRCRDCKHAEFKPGATIHCKELGADLYQWDYCSYAERRTDESNV